MRTFGIIGNPLTHSYSPKYFSEKFLREHHPDCEYRAFPLSEITQLRQLVEEIPTLSGLNVTIPFKKSVMPLLDETDEISRATGAVNVIAIQRSTERLKLSGFNTDVAGISQSLKSMNTAPGKAAILGSGGAAVAAAYALKKFPGINDWFFVSRSPVSGSAISYHDFDDPSWWNQVTLIINATPVGMYPAEHECPPIAYDRIRPGMVCMDMIYNPAETLFLKKAAASGAHIKNGIEMFRAQAEASWKIWESQR